MTKYKITVSSYYKSYGWDSDEGYEHYFHIEPQSEDSARELLNIMKAKFPFPEFQVRGTVERTHTTYTTLEDSEKRA